MYITLQEFIAPELMYDQQQFTRMWVSDGLGANVDMEVVH